MYAQTSVTSFIVNVVDNVMTIYILKIRNVGVVDRQCRPGVDQQSTLLRQMPALLIWGGLTNAVERINSKLKLSHEKVIASCVDPEGIDDCC